MLSDLKQPTRDWLADALANFSNQLSSGDDPSFTIKYDAVVMEVRLLSVKGMYERKIISIPLDVLSRKGKRK